MNNERKKYVLKQKFKIESFYIDKKDEKRMGLANKAEKIFNDIASQIEKSKFQDKEKKFKNKINSEKRYFKRKNYNHYYYFELKDNKYQYKKIMMAEYPGLKLKNDEHIIRQDLSGFFRGTTESLILFLENFYDIDSH
jgi:hypothetical protein